MTDSIEDNEANQEIETELKGILMKMANELYASMIAKDGSGVMSKKYREMAINEAKSIMKEVYELDLYAKDN